MACSRRSCRLAAGAWSSWASSSSPASRSSTLRSRSSSRASRWSASRDRQPFRTAESQDRRQPRQSGIRLRCGTGWIPNEPPWWRSPATPRPTRSTLGETLVAAGQPGQAHDQHATALGLAGQVKNKYQQAHAHYGLARVHRAAARHTRLTSTGGKPWSLTAASAPPQPICPDLGILYVHEPGGRDCRLHPGLTAADRLNRGSPGGAWTGTGGAAWTWSWTRSA